MYIFYLPKINQLREKKPSVYILLRQHDYVRNILLMAKHLQAKGAIPQGLPKPTK